MKLSVVIPAHNEAESIAATLLHLETYLAQHHIEREILVINDNSSDGTESILQQFSAEYPTIRYLNNTPPNGFGFAVRKGLEHFSGEVVAVYMADASDRVEDLLAYYQVLCEDKTVDCVFGSRFIKGGKTLDYPWFKLRINRLANTFIKVAFGLPYNDITNAFKIYRREVIQGVQPLLSHHFNLTVELPLKAIVRGYRYQVIPIYWTNRAQGQSKLKIKEMGSRYLFIVLYCLLEKWLSMGDYQRKSD